MKKIILFGALFLALVLVCGSVNAAKGEPVKDIDVMGFPFRHLQTQVDSFFDVFTEVSKLFGVDSFFDVFTELKAKDEHIETEIVSMQLRSEELHEQVDTNINQSAANKYKIDSFFDIFTEIADYYNVDSFFDVFVEIDAKTKDLQAEVVTQELRIESNTYAIDNNTNQVVANKYKIDSFFDVFTELKAKVNTFATEIVCMSIAIENQSTQITELSVAVKDLQVADKDLLDLVEMEIRDLSIAVENQQTQITELSAKVESIDNAVEEIEIIVEQIEPYSVAIEYQQEQIDALFYLSLVSGIIDQYDGEGSFFDDLYLKQSGDPLKGLNVAKARKEMLED